ncbi:MULTISPECIES: AsmA family protein [unclassified Chelatococcus]|uniref:AsmA family protein n=1 Tax=unclassified Chelatococcus TaxID=2638111 RepID=UPI001BCD3C6C|nr:MULTISPECIES: AsmA family protein [unclassified Chelatococcus]CAH1673846.1 AsmA protein [Hyphomicrobiales bacterium]MBS7738766.1 AsmA family protein [Chelatococcus sp. HY11]MBX3543170.1 AsmA family protein [Chelatococcus sp.]MCO5076704.1 AsmA family protein [Chelatococcus sp.]CAH1673911.1 AsmA protein [Hyphomicrobiales bacterium]
MTRRTFFLLASISFVLALAAVTPWAVPSLRLDREVAAQVKRVTGLTLVSEGDATLTLLPVPRITLPDVTLRAANGERMIFARQLRADVDLLAFFGSRRIAIAEATFVAPAVRLRPLTSPDLWPNLQQRLNDTSARLTPTRLTLLRGQLLDDDDNDVADDIDLVAKWSPRDDDLDFHGRARWRGEIVDFRAINIQPRSLAAGQSSPAFVSVSSRLLSASLLGTIETIESLRTRGRYSLKSPSLSDAVVWLDKPLPLTAQIGSFALSGDGDLSLRGGSIPSATIELGRNPLEGALVLRVEGDRPALSATVAADTLDLDRLLQPLTPVRSSWGSWSREAFTPMLDSAGIDIRLSANAARLGALTFEGVAAGIMMNAGRIEVSVGRAALGQGTLKGRLIMTQAQAAPGIDVKLTGSFDQIEAGDVINEVFANRRITGVAQGQLALESSGRSFATLANELGGKLTLNLRQGEIAGLDLAEIAKRVQARPLSTAMEWRGGRTNFEQIGFGLTIANGVGEITDATMNAPGLRGSLGGRIDIADRQFSLRGVVTAPTTAMPGKGFPLGITGTWDSPSIAPDIQALIERSSVTGPLFAVPADRRPRGPARIEAIKAQ